MTTIREFSENISSRQGEANFSSAPHSSNLFCKWFKFYLITGQQPICPVRDLVCGPITWLWSAGQFQSESVTYASHWNGRVRFKFKVNSITSFDWNFPENRLAQTREWHVTLTLRAWLPFHSNNFGRRLFSLPSFHWYFLPFHGFRVIFVQFFPFYFGLSPASGADTAPDPRQRQVKQKSPPLTSLMVDILFW